MRMRPVLYISGFLLAMVGGYFIAQTAVPEVEEKPAGAETKRKVRLPHETLDPVPEFRKQDRPMFQTDEEAMEAGALVGQRSLIFKSREAMEAFLARAGNRVNVMGRIDRLFALRIGFLGYGDLMALLDGSEEIGFIFPVVFPESETVGAQAGAMPMGNGLLEWLGITGDNSSWGQGIRIAVLDTGVSQHPDFGGKVVAVGAAGDVNGHGTAVASMILGNSSLLPGVAPGSTVISIQVADENGYSDSFKIAQGILAAIDAGAAIINISLGGTGDSAILRNAVALAREAGILIVAPTGNGGAPQVLKPAAYDGVIGIGAVDKAGVIMAFSNTGKGINMVAPGYGLNAGWVNEGAVSVTGTSFSSPIVAGLIAGVMSQMGVSSEKAWELIVENLDEIGQPGYDEAGGGGTPNVRRILDSGTKGIYDAAVASFWEDPAKPGTLHVTIQNQGTEALVNTGLTVSGPGGTYRFNATSLKVGGIQTFQVPMAQRTGNISRFEATVAVSGGQADARPANNSRVEIRASSPSK